MLKALDLFCKAGGATRGLQLAGFHVTGVDIEPQPRYIGNDFIQADALKVELGGFDFIWASPPCQAYSLFSRNLGTAKNHPDLVPSVRARLERSGAPWVIENVVGAPLRNPFTLCGTMFDLNLLRHRLFEANWEPGLVPLCRHRGGEIPVYGNGTSKWHLKQRGGRGVTMAEKCEAMGIDWMTRDEIKNAIPPAYAKWIAKQWLYTLEAQLAAVR